MAKKKQSTTREQDWHETFSDLLTVRLNLQGDIERATPALRPILQAALDQVNADIAPYEARFQMRQAHTWIMVTPEDRPRCAPCHCGAQAVASVCYYPGFYYHCQEHMDATYKPFDRIWSRLSNSDAEQIMCFEPACPEHAGYVQWIPTGDGKGRSEHWCGYHAFRT